MFRWLGAFTILAIVGAIAAALSMLEFNRRMPETASSGLGLRAAVSSPALRGPRDTGGAGAGGFSRGPAAFPIDDWEPGEALVATLDREFRTRAASLGFPVLESMNFMGLAMRVYRVGLPRGLAHDQALSRLRARFPDAAVDANHHYRVAGSMSLPDSVARSAIGWDAVSLQCGADLRIAMIDAAVDIHHPALRGARVSYRNFAGRGRAPGEPDHGTAVAALLVGQAVAGRGWGGLVPEARLFAANIFEGRGGGRTVATAGGLLKAVDWVIDRQVHAVNLSIAGPDNAVVRKAIDNVRRAGLVLIAAAGNWGSSTRQAFPAAYDDVIAVTAVGTDRTIYRHANRGDYIEFAAPGVRLWTAVPDGGKFQSGTSFATPFVSAIAGLAVASGAAPGTEGIRALLRRDSVDLGSPGRDTVYGWGLVGAQPACGVRAG